MNIQKMTSWVLVLSLTLLVSPHFSSARIAKGVNFEEFIVTPDHKRLVLNGIGLRQKTFFKVNVYVSALYLEKTSQDFETVLSSPDPKEVQLVFLRNVGVKDILKSWEEGFANNCETHCERFDQSIANLRSIMKDVKDREKVTFRFRDKKVELENDRKESVVLGDGDFGRLILATFIGKHPPTEEVKDGMMGKLIVDP